MLCGVGPGAPTAQRGLGLRQPLFTSKMAVRFRKFSPGGPLVGNWFGTAGAQVRHRSRIEHPQRGRPARLPAAGDSKTVSLSHVLTRNSDFRLKQPGVNAAVILTRPRACRASPAVTLLAPSRRCGRGWRRLRSTPGDLPADRQGGDGAGVAAHLPLGGEFRQSPYAARAGLDASTFSGHSLRAGFLTSAAAKGASIFKMRDQSGHKSVDTLRGYVRDAELFKDHAGAGLL
jgi:hypothetical protein